MERMSGTGQVYEGSPATSIEEMARLREQRGLTREQQTEEAAGPIAVVPGTEEEINSLQSYYNRTLQVIDENFRGRNYAIPQPKPDNGAGIPEGTALNEAPDNQMLAWNPGDGNEAGGINDKMASGGDESRGNPLDKDMSALLGNRQHIPKGSESDYLPFSKELETFAQKHHSRQDIKNFYALRKSYQDELNGMNKPGRHLSPDDVRHRRELTVKLAGMGDLEKRLAVYNLDNYNQQKVKDIRNGFAQYAKLCSSSPSQADQYLDKLIRGYSQDREAKKIIKTLCYDTGDRKMGAAVFDRAAQVESEEIFKTLQNSFPRGGGRGSCGACADQVETVMRGMDLQYNDYQRIEGTSPCTHIATELIQSRYDNSQYVGANNNIVLDMWWKGKNFRSGFDGLDYKAFLNPATSNPGKMGAYWRQYWPITNGGPFDGTVR